MLKTISMIFIIAFITINTLSAQDKRYIAFCAKASGVGHAFISLGREDPEQLMTVHDGAWGLYPVNDLKGALSIIIGEVPGKIKDDFMKQRDFIFAVTVTEAEYEEALKILEDWKNKDYELLENDCLSFLIEVANVLDGKIKIPKRSGFKNHPAKFLEEFIKQNKTTDAQE